MSNTIKPDAICENCGKQYWLHSGHYQPRCPNPCFGLEEDRNQWLKSTFKLKEDMKEEEPLHKTKVIAYLSDERTYTELFQNRVNEWMRKCFGEEISKDKIERNHRFLEESLELVQSIGCTVSEAHQLVDYVFSRPIGEVKQECGGVMVTLAALSLANNISMDECGETELKRIWKNLDKVREKQANKPKHSAFPQVSNLYTESEVKELIEAAEKMYNDLGIYKKMESAINFEKLLNQFKSK